MVGPPGLEPSVTPRAAACAKEVGKLVAALHMAAELDSDAEGAAMRGHSSASVDSGGHITIFADLVIGSGTPITIRENGDRR